MLCPLVCLVIQQQAKEEAAKKWAYTQALWAQQANEELRGFVVTQPTHGSSPDDNENGEWGSHSHHISNYWHKIDEYEDQFEPEDEEQQEDRPLVRIPFYVRAQ